MAKESDRGGVGRDLGFGEVDVVVVRFAEGGDNSLERVIAEHKFFHILACLGRLEVENELLNLANLEEAFALAHLEAGWRLDLPLGGLFTNVSENDWFLVVVLNRY